MASIELPKESLAAHFARPEHRFINRELSWLAFNARVLEEAQNRNNPLLERLNFLSISAANLDEFYMVRVAGLHDQIEEGIHTPSADGLPPKKQLELIQEAAVKQTEAQQRCWLELKSTLEDERIEVVTAKDLAPQDTEWLREYFNTNIFPLLTPIAVDPAHPFPFIPNLGVVQVLELSPPKKAATKLMALIPFPNSQPRFVRLSAGAGGVRFMLLEEVVTLFFDTLFPDFRLEAAGVFRIVRDSELDIADEADDLIRNMDMAVKKRRHGHVVRVKTMKDVPPQLLDFMLEHLQAEPEDVMEVSGMVGLSQISELKSLPRADLHYPSFKVRYPERINDYGGDCFAAIHAKDIVIHHPYESFDVVVQFLRQAAADPQVVSIKQTLYRTSHDSPIVKALIEAAEKGKSVTALVELKARFDEEANMRWARDMERAGVQVVYGFVELKTHAKISLIVRREHGGLKTYAHFGTGNYHPTTAKVYTDLSFFTCDPVLCQDAAFVFNYITGYAKPNKFHKLGVAPLTLRKNLLKLIESEIEFTRAGKPAAIWAKMNSLIDEEVIDALYAASQAGVKIELVVRGICGLRPGIKGFSDNIHVKSIIGRFLEHARICCFANGYPMPSPHAKIFIGSADWMRRNFDTRVEVMVPIENATVHRQILDQIMVANLKDARQSWRLSADGAYRRLSDDPGAFAAHDYFMTNPSLSGRGKALKQAGDASGDASQKKKQK